MTYRINEIFYSIQGEGYWAGRAAVFVRFSDCNLWDGDPARRESAICSFCDTDFVAATEMEDVDAVVNAAEDVMPRMQGWAEPMVIFTGGEPLLQLDGDLVDGFRRAGFYTALETNGTLPLNGLGVDWVCVSPKTRTVRIRKGDELKLVYPQDRVTPDHFAHLDFAHFWLSPRNAVDRLSTDNAQKAVDYLLTHPQWRLNTQVHKVIGVR